MWSVGTRLARAGEFDAGSRPSGRRSLGCAWRQARGPLLELVADLLLLGELLLCLVLWLAVPFASLTVSGLVTERTDSPGVGLLVAVACIVAGASLTLYAARRLDHLRIHKRAAAGRPSEGDPLAVALVSLTILSGLAVVVWFLFFRGVENAGPVR